MKVNNISSRMKFNYEEAYKIRLPLRMPVIVRIDGKSFHSFTRKIGLDKPYDHRFWKLISETGLYVSKHISGSMCSYSQSDEISILIHNYKKFDTNAYAGNELQKLVSHASSMASAFLTKELGECAIFDARAFVIPEAEVTNYFIWRQQDCIRNSVSSLAQFHFGHKELDGKNNKEKLLMLEKKNILWEEIDSNFRHGIFYRRGINGYGFNTMGKTPIFSNKPEVIEDLLIQEEF